MNRHGQNAVGADGRFSQQLVEQRRFDFRQLGLRGGQQRGRTRGGIDADRSRAAVSLGISADAAWATSARASNPRPSMLTRTASARALRGNQHTGQPATRVTVLRRIKPNHGHRHATMRISSTRPVTPLMNSSKIRRSKADAESLCG